MRVGLGFDAHRFADTPNRRLVLGGVEISEDGGLDGHSDADVVAHAVADALLGAAGLGDLGTLFPDSDPSYEGADSMMLLERVVGLVGRAGWVAANVDCALAAEKPRLGPHRQAMEERLAGVVGAPVTVKPKRTEGLGDIGAGRGMMCWAVALLLPADGGAR